MKKENAYAAQLRSDRRAAALERQDPVIAADDRRRADLYAADPVRPSAAV